MVEEGSTTYNEGEIKEFSIYEYVAYALHNDFRFTIILSLKI